VKPTKLTLTLLAMGVLFTGCSKINSTEEINEEPIDPIEKKVQEQVKTYDQRVTTFDPKNYFIPESKQSTAETKVACEFGMGGEIPALGTGMFSQPLYRIEAEKIIDKNIGDVLYAPYSLVTTIANDVLYETEVDSFDRQLNTYRSVQIQKIPLNIISTHGFFTNSNKAVVINQARSYPVGYVRNMNGLQVRSAMFNDACNKDIGIRDYEWREIDISGKPLDSITSTVSEHQVRINQMGMFSGASNFFSYFGQEFGGFLTQNMNFKSALKSAGRFPVGSKIYVPKAIKTTDETLVVMQSEDQLISNFDPVSLGAMYTKEAARLNLGKIEFKKHDLKNDVVFYTPWAIDKHREAIEFDPVVVIKGKAYFSVWHLPNSLTYSDSTGSGSLTYYNATAHNAFVGAVKGIYQGQGSMIGTEHEDDTKYSMKTAIEYQKAQKSVEE